MSRKEDGSIMKKSSEALKEVTRIIDNGEAGQEVVLPINVAALAFGIKGETLKRLGERDQGIEMEVAGDLLTVRLTGPEAERRAAYTYLYALVQNMNSEAGRRLVQLAKVPRILTEEIPDFSQTIEVIKGGDCTIPDEDRATLQVYLFAHWLSLKDKTNLHDPFKVLDAVAY